MVTEIEKDCAGLRLRRNCFDVAVSWFLHCRYVKADITEGLAAYPHCDKSLRLL